MAALKRRRGAAGAAVDEAPPGVPTSVGMSSKATNPERAARPNPTPPATPATQPKPKPKPEPKPSTSKPNTVKPATPEPPPDPNAPTTSRLLSAKRRARERMGEE